VIYWVAALNGKPNTFRAITMLFYILQKQKQKKKLKKVAYFSKIWYHTKSQDPILIVDSVTPTSKVCIIVAVIISCAECPVVA
jgi:hypothetical protein